MDGLLLPMILLAADDTPNQKSLFTQILPAMIPGSQTQRLVVATITAKKQNKIQADIEEAVVRDAMKAADFHSRADLDSFKALEAAFNRLPASVQAEILTPSAPPPGGGSTKSGGNT